MQDTVDDFCFSHHMKSPTILYTEAETLYRGARCAVYRAHREDNGSPVILKALRYEPAPDREVARFKREYELTHRLNVPGVIGCYELHKRRRPAYHGVGGLRRPIAG